MRTVAALTIALSLAACAEPKREAPPKPDAKVAEWAAIASGPRQGPDNSLLVDLQLQVTVTGGWHVYSLTQDKGGPTPMSVTVEPPYEIAGEIAGPPPVKAQDPNFNIETETYSGEQVFKIPLRLAGSNSLAAPPIEVKVRSQACSDNLCLPAKTTHLTVMPEAGSP